MSIARQNQLTTIAHKSYQLWKNLAADTEVFTPSALCSCFTLKNDKEKLSDTSNERFLEYMQSLPMLDEAAVTFSILGSLLYHEPTEECTARLVQNDIFADIPFAHQHTAVQTGMDVLRTWHGQALKNLRHATEQMKHEWSQLFAQTGTEKAPLYKSHYIKRENMLNGRTAGVAQDYYRLHGLEVRQGRQKPLDHLGPMLQFLAYLLALEAQALGEWDFNQVDALRDEEFRFLREHINPWIESWHQAVCATGGSGFYRGISYLCVGAVSTLYERF